MNILMRKFEICLLITVFIMLILIYLSAKSKKFSILDRFVDKLSVIVGIFVAVSVLLTYRVFRDNLEHTTIDNTFQMIDRGWIKINKEIFVYYKYCPNLVNSLFFDWQKSDWKKEKSEKNLYNTTTLNIDHWYAKNYISNLIFETVEDFLTTHISDETGDYAWMCTFLQWTKSPILKNMWDSEKTIYTDTTIELLDLLFKISETSDIKNVQDLKKVGEKIVNSEEYKEIIIRRNAARIY